MLPISGEKHPEHEDKRANVVERTYGSLPVPSSCRFSRIPIRSMRTSYSVRPGSDCPARAARNGAGVSRSIRHKVRGK